MYDVKDVQQLLEVGECRAYNIIRMLNSELKEKNYIVIRGKVPVAYFHERIYDDHNKETA